MNRPVCWLLCAAVLLLNACASTPPDLARDSGDPALLQQWQAAGKIALRSASQSESASLSWIQDGLNSRLELSGPLGFSATTVTSDGEHIAIRQGDEVQRWAIDDPAFAAQNQWQLPLASLHYWLKGVPAPAVPVDALARDPATRLPRHLRQQGWNIEYLQFGQFGGFQLPTRLQIDNNGTRARIILRDWTFPATP